MNLNPLKFPKEIVINISDGFEKKYDFKQQPFIFKLLHDLTKIRNVIVKIRLRCYFENLKQSFVRFLYYSSSSS